MLNLIFYAEFSDANENNRVIKELEDSLKV